MIENDQRDKRNLMKDVTFQKEDFKLFANSILCLVIAFLVLVMIESFQRGVQEALNFISEYKTTALLNYLILLITIAPAMMIKRVSFLSLLLSLPWCILAAMSVMLMRFRGVPLIWADFNSVKEGAAIAKEYVSFELIVQISLGAGIILLILISSYFIKFKTYEVSCIKRFLVCIVLIGIGFLGRSYLMQFRAGQEHKWEIATLYKRNGFIHSLSKSCLYTMRRKPSDYSKEGIEAVISYINKSQKDNFNSREIAESAKKPNIIMVQLEGFFDPTAIKETYFNEDPIPYFRKYFNEGYSGLLQVPTIGGGTVRTEFEVIAGVNLDYFAPGEIPYNSGVTQRGPIETIAYILKTQDYKTTAIHNFEGNFYSRHEAYKNLGFDRFIPMESMTGLVKYRAFPEDMVLIDYIKRALEASEERDFIFTITAGSHGPYHTTLNKGNEAYVSGNLKETSLYQLQNYTSLIRRTDKFVGKLAEYIYSLEEPTVLIIYSDHYPQLESLEELDQDEKFKTPYFIIDNQNKVPHKRHNDIEAYQLSTDVLNLTELKGGMMNTFHTLYRYKKDYQKKLRNLQYYTLFSEESFGVNKDKYKTTQLEIGLEKLEITTTKYQGDRLIIGGNGFTESSRIFINNHSVETEFISPHTLIGKGIGEKAKSINIEVKYIGRYGVSILRSNVF
ncbi:LTA synthase family protein [Cellulosilyticum sp. I15G10I2]|uniref:LTA synthase family protein n=1 Tax=Cellulosilyticum sp. I15G10I2 TaxID=1892843 RepID=UPI00085C8D50|nr:LTA synthase family protein [Cellulosilyticum sp. I15G10I2]